MAADKFMSEIRLKQPECLYSACDSFSKSTKIQRNRRVEIYLSEWTREGYFSQDMIYGAYEDDEVFAIVSKPKYDGLVKTCLKGLNCFWRKF